jgi:hypothetical protein
LRYLIRNWTHQHYVYTEWLVCHFFAFTDFLKDHIRTCIDAGDDSQTSGIGDCTGQSSICNPGHATLQDRVFNTQ